MSIFHYVPGAFADHGGVDIDHKVVAAPPGLDHSLFHFGLMPGHPSPPLHHGFPAARYRVQQHVPLIGQLIVLSHYHCDQISEYIKLRNRKFEDRKS